MSSFLGSTLLRRQQHYVIANKRQLQHLSTGSLRAQQQTRRCCDVGFSTLPSVSSFQFVTHQQFQQKQQQQQQHAVVLRPRHSVRYLSSSSSSSTTSNASTSSTLDDLKQYLSQESYPLGSLDLQTGKEIIASIQRFVVDAGGGGRGGAVVGHHDHKQKNGREIKFAFELLDRLSLEIQFQHQQQQYYVFNRKNNHRVPNPKASFYLHTQLIQHVVGVWKKYWMNNRNDNCSSNNNIGHDDISFWSPQMIFSMLQDWEERIDQWQPYKLVLDAALSKGHISNNNNNNSDPELAEEILHYMLIPRRKKRTIPTTNYYKDVTITIIRNEIALSFYRVIVGWVKSGRHDAAVRADAVLQHMIQHTTTADSTRAKPTTRSFNLVLRAWAETAAAANNNKDFYAYRGQAPRRAEHLLHQMDVLGVRCNSTTYSYALTALAQSANSKSPYRALTVLKHMIALNEKGKGDITPSPACFAEVISSFIRHGDIRRADELFQEQIQRFKSTRNPIFLPTNESLTTIINACVTLNKKLRLQESLQLAHDVLQQMEDVALFLESNNSNNSNNEPSSSSLSSSTSLQPNVAILIALLHEWANSNYDVSPIRCEELLAKIHDLCRRGDPSNHDALSFSSVKTLCYIALKCWIRSSHREAPLKAEAFLRRMLELHDQSCSSATTSTTTGGDSNNTNNTNLVNGFKPDIYTFVVVMNALSMSGNPEQAQKIYDEMFQRYKEGDEDLKPNLHVFTMLIRAWLQNKKKDCLQKAKELFDNMLALYRSGQEEQLRPDKDMYLSYIELHANYPERAEEILQEMHSNGPGEVKPDIYLYNTVMRLWANSGSHINYRGERVQALFDEAVQKYKDGDSTMKPTEDSYAILICGWSFEKDGGTEKVQAIYDDMVSSYQSGAGGEAAPIPNVAVFNAFLKALARAKDPEKVERILREMNSNDHDLESTTSAAAAPVKLKVKPNAMSYAAVMHAWSRSGLPEAGHRAQALFDELLTKYQAGDPKFKPNKAVILDLLQAWSKTSCLEGATRAQEEFDSMLSRYRNSPSEQRPHVFHYNTLIDAWGRAIEPEKAERVLRGMNSDPLLGVKPNAVTYHCAIGAWCYYSKKRLDDSALDRAQSLYDELKQQRKQAAASMNRTVPPPGVNTIELLLSSWCESSRPDAIAKAEAVLEDLLIRYQAGNEEEEELKPVVEKCTAMIRDKREATGHETTDINSPVIT